MDDDRRPRHGARAPLLAGAALLLALVVPGAASAGQYAVVSCDAAPGGAAHAWQPQAGSFNSYSLCPSAGVPTRGMSTRLTGPGDTRFPAGAYSRLWFHAPGGTHIAGLEWSGRMARNACTWQVELRAQGGYGVHPLIRWRGAPGQTSCTTAYEQPHASWHPAPGGTVAVMQNTQCGAQTCPTGATFHTYYSRVVLNDFSPPALSIGGVGNGEWVRADRTISFNASDNIGIKRAQLYIDGHLRGSANYHCDYTHRVPCSNHSGAFPLLTRQLSPGRHRVEVRVYDGSDTPVVAGRTIYVDNTPPAQVTAVVTGGDGWRNGNSFSVGWESAEDGGAPIVAASWQLCEASGEECVIRRIKERDPTAIPPFEVPGDGTHELRVVLHDQAGNVATLRDARPALLRLDREPPAVSIHGTDPSAPIRATATVTDSLSGLAGGQLELRRVGTETWRELATGVEGSQLVAQIDDERYRDGRYELRALARDHAGNATATGVEANGARALRDLPLRIKTRLRVGRPVVRTVRRKVGRAKKRRVVKRRVRRLRPRARVRYKRRTVLRGVLRNPDGQPLHDVPIHVSARQAMPGAGFAAAGIVRTNKRGRFRYRVRGTASRTLRFRYPGTGRIQPTTADVGVRVPASSSFKLTPRRILNGETVTFRGRVRGGPIPANGKLIELRKWTGRKWAPFRVVRTDSGGRWSHTEPVVSVAGVVIFKLRAHLPAEAGFPYARGRTKARRLRVRGL